MSCRVNAKIVISSYCGTISKIQVIRTPVYVESYVIVSQSAQIKIPNFVLSYSTLP